jgi:hypothetical protein
MEETTDNSSEEVFNAPNTVGEGTNSADGNMEGGNSTGDATGNDGKGQGEENDIFNAPKGEAEANEDGKEEPNTEAQAEENPIEYSDFAFPEGMEAPDETRMKDFTGWAKENKLSQEQAQSAIDMQIKLQAENTQQVQQATENYRRDEEKQLISDAEYGGKNIKETYERGKRYILNELDPALKDVVVAGGWIHPQLMKHFAKLEKGTKNSSGTSEPTSNHKGDPANMKPANVKDSHLMYPNDAPK